MANEIIRPAALPVRTNPVPSEVVPSDNNTTVAGVTWENGVNAAVPPATQSESEAGVINTKRMTPLTTRQAIDAQVPPKISSAIAGLNLGSAAQAQVSDFATAAQGALADTAVQPSRTVSTGAGLTGGGTLATDQTIALNPASIASLAKADTSVQAVNGNSPDGSGNVVIDAEFTQEQDSRASALLATFAPTVEWVRTAGYASAGDGGGALYKRVSSEPAHAGKFQSADGAWWETDLRNGVNVLQFGAKGDGGADDYAAIQSAVDAISTTGGIIRIPRGVYNLSAGLVITQNTSSWHDTKRVSFIGDGSGLVRFVYTGPATSGAVVRWETSSTNDSDGTYGNSWAKIGGFLIEGSSVADYGLAIHAKSWFEADDIRVLGCIEANYYFTSTVSWSGRSLRSYGSKIGMRLEMSASHLSYSLPNNITLIDVTIGNATQWGVHARNSGPINFIGGSFESNGTQGVDGSGGAYLVTSDAGIGIETVAANFYGTYFEHNKGGADVYFAQQSNSLPRTVNLQGAIFNRISSTGYTTNNVRLEVTGSAAGKVNITGCGFSFGGDYSPNSARRCVAMTGNVGNNGNSINYDTATVFRSGTDGPSDLNGPWGAPDALAFATLRCNPDGSILRGRNIFSVTRTSTGNYAVQFNYSASSTFPQVVGSIVGGGGSVGVVLEGSGGVTVRTADQSGAVVDQAFSLVVYDA